MANECGNDEYANALDAMYTLNMIDPLFLKNVKHLTPEEKAKSDAYQRRSEERLKNIKDRCDFFELMRNKHLWHDKKQDFNKLLTRSCAKTNQEELPAEFRDYAA